MEKAQSGLESFNTRYEFDLKPILTQREFYIQTIQLAQLALEREQKSEFYNKTVVLLDYVLRMEDSQSTLLLVETLMKIQQYSSIYITDHATNLRQLRNILLIPFEKYRLRISYYTLKIVNNCEGNTKSENISHVFKDIKSEIISNIYECHSLNLILEFLHTCLITGNRRVFILLFERILNNWDVFSGQITEKKIEKLLWYGFVIGYDSILLKRGSLDGVLLESNRAGIKLYKYLQNKLSNQKSSNLNYIEKVIDAINNKASFSSFEKEHIIGRIEIRAKVSISDMRSPKNSKSSKDVIFSKDIRRLSPYSLPPGTTLGKIKKKVNVTVAVYESKISPSIIKTLKVELFTDRNQIDYYATKKTIKTLKEASRTGHLSARIVEMPKVKKEKTQIKVANEELFKWPSTEVNQTNTKNDLALSEKSALRKLGYQITDSTKSERWSILEQAVPKLGLRTVAYTIAGNVKLRKGQKNGPAKFRYAISEWEHDLNKLKQAYYKKDFPWPKI